MLLKIVREMLKIHQCFTAGTHVSSRH